MMSSSQVRLCEQRVVEWEVTSQNYFILLIMIKIRDHYQMCMDKGGKYCNVEKYVCAHLYVSLFGKNCSYGLCAKNGISVVPSSEYFPSEYT